MQNLQSPPTIPGPPIPLQQSVMMPSQPGIQPRPMTGPPPPGYQWVVGQPRAPVPPRKGVNLGYPSLAAFMDLDNGVMLFRRFGSLYARNLLYMQHEIAQLESELKREDMFQKNAGIDLGQIAFDSHNKTKIMLRLREVLKEYADNIEAASKMRDHKLASRDQRRNLNNWLVKEKPLFDLEGGFADAKDDMIAIATSEKSLLDRFVARQRWLIKAFFNKERKLPDEVPQDPKLFFFSDYSVARTVKWVVVVLSLIFLILPMLVLQLVLNDRSANIRAGFAAGFIVIFTFFMSAFTLARPAEILAATAGYSAVLVVFMANQVSGSPGSSTPPTPTPMI